MISKWSIVESSFDPATAKAYEGLFTLGSGYMHVRGSLEEGLASAPQDQTYTRLPANVTSESVRETASVWGTYVPGIYGVHPLLNRQLINLPFFLGINPIVAGERFDMESCDAHGHRRVLNLRTATLARSLRWRTRAGPIIDMRYERFISAARPHLCIQRLSLSTDAVVDMTVLCGIDADVRTNGHDHFAETELSPTGDNGIACHIRTDAGDEVNIETRLLAHAPAGRFEPAGRSAAWVRQLSVRPGEPTIFEKRTAVTTSRDPGPGRPAAWLDEAASLSYDELHGEHAAHWRRRWEACDVLIEDDDESQLAMRASLFHLLRSHVPNDPRVAIDAKGYAGEAYWGRFFWDTEMYLLPFFAHTDPARARTLVDFRVQSLDGARANARRYGYRGARYAWESDPDGNECCPNWQYADHEVHITADVVHGLVHYARAGGDDGYLRGPAARVIVETARYWMTRLDRRPGEDYPSLLGVMGPDEYTPISNNNAYTNRLVSFALASAAEYGKHGGATAEERAAFARAADTLPIPRHVDGVLILQCEEFESLAEPRFDEFWTDRTRTFAAQVAQERLYRSRCLKQADVLMLMMLFPGEFSDAEVRRAWDYYVPYTTHDSSLSAGVHAIVACRLGLFERAWQFWNRARSIDLDVARGGAAEGIHIAAAGAAWQIVVFGFAGMHSAVHSDVLTLRPRLPEQWSRLAFPLVWKGCPVYVNVARSTTSIANRGKTPLTVTVHGDTREVPPECKATWENPA